MARKSRTICYAMSRRLKYAITVVALLAAFFIACYDQATTARREQSPSPPASPTQGSDRYRYHDRDFIVTEVIDGDTLDIDVPDGDKPVTRIRLIGVDTPETKKPGEPVMYYGPEAFEFTKAQAEGKQVRIWLDAGSQTRDKYGRLLAYVRLGDGRILNEELLSEGFAYAELRFKHGAYQKYQQLEAGARRNEKGLWKDVRREQLPQWLQKRKPKLLSWLMSEAVENEVIYFILS